MRLVTVLICILAAGIAASAQNLVPNSGFESNTGIPNGPGQFSRVVSWNNVNGWPTFQWPYASPDYLHTSGSGGAQLPGSVFGNVSPYQGNAVMGAISWYTTANFREYIACQLTSPMTPGQSYDVTIHVSNGTSSFRYGTYGPQICFSVGPLSQSTHEPINVTPQLTPSSIIYSTGWMALTYNFTPTQAFTHMTVGNFRNDASTVLQSMGGGQNGAYYFYDGASVVQAVVLDDGSLTLSGLTDGKENLLEWAHDGPSTAFSVWRSADGGQFRKLGVTGPGGPQSFRDEAPLYGTNWYKVRKQNPDGSLTWSNALQLESTGESPLQFLSVFPVPAADEMTVQLEHPDLPEIHVTLVDATGRLVLEREVATFGQRMTSFKLPVDRLAAGVYTLRLRAGNSYTARPVVVGR